MVDPTAIHVCEAIIAAYLRTPFGRYGGVLAGL
jgi:hypothetical protein